MRASNDIPHQAADGSFNPEIAVNIRDILKSLGPDFLTYADTIDGLRERLARRRFHLAVLGQFKRGKSTLLNALLGEPALPVSVVPLTAIPTFISYGERRGLRVEYQNGRPAEEFNADDRGALSALLARYVTEELNPANRLGVRQVDVRHPAPILRDGVVLIDTPGIGSTYRHNTEATLNFLPSCDAALFLVSADPPITEVEVAFLGEVRRRMRRLFFIFNKIDYLSADELSKMIEFVSGVLGEKVTRGEELKLFPVSAKRGLEARVAGDSAGWGGSGMEEVERYLVDFLARKKNAVLADAVADKIRETLGDALTRLDLAARSLELSIVDLEERLKSMETTVEDVRRQVLYSGDVLAGERKRLMATLEEQAEALRASARSYLRRVVDGLWEESAETPDENTLREAVADAIPGYFEHHLARMSGEFDAAVKAVFDGHRGVLESHIEKVRDAAAELFNVPRRASGKADSLDMTAEPYWVTHRWNSTFVPVPRALIERVMPEGVRGKRLRRRLERQIDELVIYNVENLRWSTLQNLDAAFRKLELDYDNRLNETLAATHGAIRAVYERRSAKSEEISDELTLLKNASEELGQLYNKLPAGEE
ncbi:MAG TPA: Dynamin family protein [Spirochaetes bacterium]|nr:Dynamin family protein [Spirochaetota bacterium]